MNSPLPSEEKQPKFHRILSDEERIMITPEAYGYIIKMVELGLLNFEETESLIERAIHTFDFPILKEDIQLLITGILLEGENSSFHHIRLLNSSNLIN